MTKNLILSCLILPAVLISGYVPLMFAADPAPADESSCLWGSKTSTAAPNGKWHEYFNAHDAAVVAANADALWFRKGEYVWRYNVQARKVDVWTSAFAQPDLHGNGANGAVADDGRFAVGNRAAIYLWSPKDGWTRLPLPSAKALESFLSFGPDGNLWAFEIQGSDETAFQFKDGLWQNGITQPERKAFFHVDDGWLMVNNSGRGPLTRWVNEKFEVNNGIELQSPGYPHNFYRLAGQAFGIFSQTGSKSTLAVSRIGKEKNEKLVEANFVGLDLAHGQAFTVEPGETGQTAAIHDADGKQVAELPLPPNFDSKQGGFLRDGNGDYWYGHWRWSGKVWQPIMPPQGFDFPGLVKDGLRSGRLVYDAKGDTWVDAWPGLPAGVEGYDPKGRTGWLLDKPVKYPDYHWTHYRFAPDGSRTVLEEVKIKASQHSWAATVLADAHGHFWFGTRWRWDGKKLAEFDDGWQGHKSAELGVPEIFLSSQGTVRRYVTNRSWERFDDAKAAFVADEPFDESAFSVAGRNFSAAGLPQDRPMDWNSDLGLVQLKDKSGHWVPLETPLAALVEFIQRRGNQGGKPANYYGWPGRLAHGDRLLLESTAGVFEWDVRRDKWAYLLPWQDYWAGFDAAGRRLMVSNSIFSSGQILIYDGEPFAETAVRVAGAVQDNLGALLKRMDDPSERVRDAATAELKTRFARQPVKIGEFLKTKLADPDLPPEVSYRLGLMLQDPPKAAGEVPRPKDLGELKVAADREIGNSLFDRMTQHQKPKFPGGYVLKVGMRSELALEILSSVGCISEPAKQFAEEKPIPNFGYGLRCLMPDNTMIYLSVVLDAGQPVILSIGRGETGQGDDPKWSWYNADRNGLKELDLSPPTGTIH